MIHAEMDSSSQFIVPTIIDVPELIVTNDEIDFDDANSVGTAAWLNKLRFLATTLSYVVNLGNVWRFPYLCYKNGGGAFLLVYSFLLVVLGLPLFLMELVFGQYANEGPITIWRVSPAFEGVGYAMCLISASVAIYFNVINTWIIHYLLASLTFSELPWSRCDNSWNSKQCFLRTDEPSIMPVNCSETTSSTETVTANSLMNSTSATGELTNSSILVASSCQSSMEVNSFERIINSTADVTLPASEYFHNNVLKISPSFEQLGEFNWTFLFGSIVALGPVYVALLKDIRLTGRPVIVTLVLPYLCLGALLLRFMTLPGFTEGMAYYFTPQWQRLKDIDIWADATSQIFFALSPCWGGLITMASMNKFHNNFHADTMLIVGINYASSLLAGAVAFAIVGNMSKYSGISISEVVETGVGFVFMVYTEGLAKLPMANLNAILFLAMFLYVGFSCQITVIETVITTIVDTWPHKLRYRKPLVLMTLCSSILLIGLTISFGNSIYIIQLMDNFVGTYTAMAIGILELIAIAWVYGIENFMQDIDDMISVHRNLFPSRSYWYTLWRYFTPSLLFAILLFCFIDQPSISYRKVELPNWTLKFCWVITCLILAVVPVMAIIRFLLSPSGSFLDRVSYLCRPSEDWAPSSYVSGPKLLNRHMTDIDLNGPGAGYSNQPGENNYADQDQESNESNEDLKVVDGKANYIIPEEDETDTEFIVNEALAAEASGEPQRSRYRSNN